MTEPTLFDLAPVPKPKHRDTASIAPKWTSNTTRATCHDCVRELADGKFITAMRAQWRRTHGADVALYCYPHATPRRDADRANAQRVA